METEEQEALFHSYPCALYYVQSPSTVSRANSVDCPNHNEESAVHSPLRSENLNHTTNTITQQEVSRFALSRYSSSLGSNNSFLHEKKMAYDLDHESNGISGTQSGKNRLIILGDGDDDDDDDDEDGGRRDEWWRFFSFRTHDSFMWMCLQISWRILVSMGAALLVFYIATKPPPPKLSVKMAGIRQFSLTEGVDGSGVETKILSCNCSISLVIDNKSKIFGLHLGPPLLAMSFGSLPLASSHGTKLYAVSDGSTLFQLSVGTMSKPMYGAGRSMEDMLESGKGLPLVLRMSLKSDFRVVWNLIKPKFHHQAECLLILGKTYDKKHQTQAYKSSCMIKS